MDPVAIQSCKGTWKIYMYNYNSKISDHLCHDASTCFGPRCPGTIHTSRAGWGGAERYYPSSRKNSFFRKAIHIPPPQKPLKSCCDFHPYPTQEADLQTKFHSLTIKQSMFASASILLLAVQIQRKKKRIFTARGRDL